ncbi:type II toxin-antitoxin system RelE family toxin [Kroppenstedtia eburnea]|nr:hypothetical protein [Kroppenstedtia eburnea]QKI82637.1 hypothetical protein GXN75_11920 [Kroppenstedtia eburnea]
MSLAYRTVLKRQAVKFLSKQDKPTRARILSAIEGITRVDGRRTCR